MSHIHTEPGQHDHTVTAYIVRIDGAQPRILLHMHRRYAHLMGIGGHIELTETPWQAIAHELREESGYELKDLQVLQPEQRLTHLSNSRLHPQPVGMMNYKVSDTHYHADTVYAFTATSEPRYPVAEGESTDLRWLTRDEIVALSDDDIYINSKETALYIFDTCLVYWQQIPAVSFEL